MKLRRNHERSQQRRFSAIKLIIFIVMAVVFGFFGLRILDNLLTGPSKRPQKSALRGQELNLGSDIAVRNFLPESTTGAVVHHSHYSLSYHEKYEQAEWVAYELTKKSLQLPNVPRAKRFEPDYAIETRSAFYRDYSGSGYDRGHLVPAADMAFDLEAMQQTFLMSNISPQDRSFNAGVWNELESAVRDWAYDNGSIYVVSGPVFSKGIKTRIGQNKVAVPNYFFKAVVDLTKPEHKSIAFLLPNELSTAPLSNYAISIDSLEEILGYNLFFKLMEPDQEEALESQNDVRKWRIDPKRYQTRLNVWNKQR